MSYTPTQNSPIFAFYNNAKQTLIAASPSWPTSSNTDYEVNVDVELQSQLGTGSSSDNININVHGDAHIMSDIRTCFDNVAAYEIIMSSRFLSNSTEKGHRGQDRGENLNTPVNVYDVRARTDEYAKAKVEAFQPFKSNVFNLVASANRNNILVTIPKECALVGILT